MVPLEYLGSHNNTYNNVMNFKPLIVQNYGMVKLW